jgi:integrase
MERGTAGLGRLFLRGTTWWWAIGVGKGKKLRISTKLRGGTPDTPPVEVELWRVGKLAELDTPSVVGGGQVGSVTVSDILDMLTTRYKAEDRKASLRTTHSRVKALRDGLGAWKAIDLKPYRILEYAVARKKEGAAVATVNMELRLLARAYRIAVEYGHLVAVPPIRKLHGENVRRQHVPDVILDQIRETLPEWASDAVSFLRLTGWRLQEGLGLEWDRVDFAEKTIRLDTSKTGEPRVLNFSMYPDLAELLHKRQGVRTTSPYVFLGPRGKRAHAETLRGLWKAAAAKAGLPDAILHDLRRSMVRAMDRAGIPRTVAMTITGHKSERVYNQYGLVDEAAQAEALSKLGSAPQAQEDRVIVPAARFRLSAENRALRQLVADALPHLANTEAAADVLARMRAAIGEGERRDQAASVR